MMLGELLLNRIPGGALKRNSSCSLPLLSLLWLASAQLAGVVGCPSSYFQAGTLLLPYALPQSPSTPRAGWRCGTPSYYHSHYKLFLHPLFLAVTFYSSGWLALWSSVYGVWSGVFYARNGRFIYPFLGALLAWWHLPLALLLLRLLRAAAGMAAAFAGGYAMCWQVGSC